jgi:hypothetical protein
MTEEKPKVALEVAEAEFERFCKALRLRKALAGVSSDARVDVLSAMQDGRLVVDEKGRLVFRPLDDGDPLTFHPPRGADLMAMDQKPEGQKIAALHAVAASLTRDHEKRFSNMDLRDAEIVYAIIGLLMGG